MAESLNPRLFRPLGGFLVVGQKSDGSLSLSFQGTDDGACTAAQEAVRRGELARCYVVPGKLIDPNRHSAPGDP